MIADGDRHAIVQAAIKLRDRAATDAETAAQVQLGVLDLNDEILSLREQLRRLEATNAALRAVIASPTRCSCVGAASCTRCDGTDADAAQFPDRYAYEQALAGVKAS